MKPERGDIMPWPRPKWWPRPLGIKGWGGLTATDWIPLAWAGVTREGIGGSDEIYWPEGIGGNNDGIDSDDEDFGI